MQATCSRGNTATAEETQQRAEEREKQHQIQARVAAQISQAKRHANIYKPPEGISMWASAKEIGCHFGVGMGLYFQMLEWLMILFSCITFLSFPFWIVINQSIFTDEANKNRESVGLKVFEGPSLLATTFATIPDHQLDPNNTLVYMNTELGDAWYGPMKKNDFLLWISLLDVVGVVLTIFLVTYYTWKAGWFELSVDKNTYDATDYAVLVTGLPPDAGFHEVGHFFSRFGEVIDVTLVLDMGRVLQACAKASRLEHKREQLASIVRLFPAESGKRTQKQLEQTEEELILLLKDINEDMDRAIAERQRPLSGSAILRHPSNLLRPEKWGSLQRHQHDPVHAADAESGLPPPKPLSEAEGEKVALGKHDSEEWDGNTDKEFTKKAVYDTKAAFVTFNRMSEAKKCLKLTPNPGWIGWLYRHTVAQDAQCIRGHCIETVRARNPTDYIFENMCFSEVLRFWHKFGIRLLYLFLLIVCALIVSGLSSRTRVNLDRTDLDFSNNIMNTDIGSAASFLPQSAPPGSTVSQLRELFEEAMQEASSSATPPAFSPKLARKANFTDYCKLALPEVCAEHYRQSLGGAQEVELGMTFGEHLQWGSNFDEVVYERPVLNSFNKLAGAADPRAVEGTDVGLSACLACYCLGLAKEEETEQKPGDWLLVSKQHCAAYIAGEQDAGTETAISVVIAVLNIVLKLFVQFLAAAEKQWTRSEMEMSFCVVAYTSQLLNSVLVVLLVNARPNARSTETGERVGEEDIQWLRYIILGGSFDDFSAQWYEYVGQSFMILLFIQTIFPLVNIAIEVVVKGVQRMMVWLNRDATQDDYNNAYNHPNFLLQQRVADVMLNVSVALLFCSGMPLCAATVILVFGVASIMDRWAVTCLMTVTRYGSELPRLILGLLPWMVFLHCGFGLWQHSYFMMQNWDKEATSVFVQTGKDQLERGIKPEAAFGEYIDERSVKTRISQPNSFGLFLLALIMFLWLFFRHVIQRWLDPILRLWIDGKMQENFKEGDNDDNGRFWVLRKILAMPKLQLPGMPETPEDDDDCMTFEKALTEKRLKGMPTFRLPFHPRYADAFSGLLHGPIWSRMLGPYRYTRLVPVREEEPLTIYRVEVKTCSTWGAGTDADVLIQIFGAKDGKEVSTGLHELFSIHNNFERGKMDVFMLSLRDVGRMERIEVRSCVKGLFGSWHLEFVRITDCVRGVTLMFPCGNWLDRRRPESLLQILLPSGDAPSESRRIRANQHKAIPVAAERASNGAAHFLDQNPKGVSQKDAQAASLPGEAALEGGCNGHEQPGGAVSSSLGPGGVILEEDGSDEVRTTGNTSIFEGGVGTYDTGEEVEGMDREKARGNGHLSSDGSEGGSHIETCQRGPGLKAGAADAGPPPVLVPSSLPARSGNKCGTLKRQRQERLVQINLSWKVSDTLILHAKDAPLDEKYGDFERFEYGPALSSYLASMQAPESPRIEASSRLMKARD